MRAGPKRVKAALPFEIGLRGLKNSNICLIMMSNTFRKHKNPNLDDMDLQSRLRFLTSVLHSNFLAIRFVKNMYAALKSTAAERCAKLRDVASLGTPVKADLEKYEFFASVFETSVPLEDQIAMR